MKEGKKSMKKKTTAKTFAIGIDLGTTTTLAYVVNENGEIFPVKNFEKDGNITQSIVGFQSDDFIVGNSANTVEGKNMLREMKRIIGRKGTEIKNSPSFEQLPFKCKFDEKDRAFAVVDNKGEEMELSPISVAALLLKHIRSNAEEQFDTTITDAVISCPAYFNQKQRLETKYAGDIAGLNVLRIMDEPTSGAINYIQENIGKASFRGKTLLI